MGIYRFKQIYAFYRSPSDWCIYITQLCILVILIPHRRTTIQHLDDRVNMSVMNTSASVLYIPIIIIWSEFWILITWQSIPRTKYNTFNIFYCGYEMVFNLISFFSAFKLQFFFRSSYESFERTTKQRMIIQFYKYIY